MIFRKKSRVNPDHTRPTRQSSTPVVLEHLEPRLLLHSALIFSADAPQLGHLPTIIGRTHVAQKSRDGFIFHAAPGTTFTRTLAINIPALVPPQGYGGLLFNANLGGSIIYWGDGSVSAGTTIQNKDGSYTVAGSHAYSQRGIYSISTSIFADFVALDWYGEAGPPVARIYSDPVLSTAIVT